MKSVSKRELNQNTAQVLAEVDSGGAVVVTERGVARWRIEVLSPAESGRAHLGVSRAARRRGGWARLKRHTVAEHSSQALDEIRSERV